MADDGMLLNFSIGDGVINTQQKFKGGTWRDRLVAKKIAVNKRNKANNPGAAADNTSSGGRKHVQNANRVEISTDRAAKRQKLDRGTFKPSTTSTAQAGNSQDQPRKPQNHTREVISSLFTYNPSEKNAPAAADGSAGQDEGAEVKASNAPLVDGIDTFTSLGLSPNLAAHLLTKLNLKTPTAIQKSSIPQLLKQEGDAFLQAETGSGKTLAYLLPLVQQLMNLSNSKDHMGNSNANTPAVNRDSGLFAIVLAPTRELCKQISIVLEGLLRCAHWIVAGTVIGGEKKKSEKARLRKGLNILVATPGRLADHLENTKVLDVRKVRWLILDEGDRLMDLGFEDEIQGIIKKLDMRRMPDPSLANLPERRTTVLCSATLKMNVQRLGEMSLKDAIHVQADPADEADEDDTDTGKNNEFSAPAQLKQSYVVAAAKLRLATLTALLKRTFARKGTVMKAIVFVSCADSVDFHFEAFSREIAGVVEADKKKEDKKQDENEEEETEDDEGEDDEEEKEKEGGEEKGKDDNKRSNIDAITSLHGTVAKATTISSPSNQVVLHRLHGSLPQNVRTATLSAFAKQRDTSLLICTDVAARGLDLPNIDYVIEYDPAFCADDHLHRIGRTARLGRDGRAMIFLLPGNEEGYVDILKSGFRDDSGKSVTRQDVNEIMKRGFGGNSNASSKGWEEAATDWQLEMERWALENPKMLEMGRRAFQSHIRAYATHIASERNMFNIKDLHLGHLAKSFALRDRPGNINVPGLRASKDETKKSFKADRKGTTGDNSIRTNNNSSNTDSADAARKMRMKLKQMSSASEFNIA